MKMILTPDEYSSLRTTIANLKTEGVIDVWNWFMDSDRTYVQDGKVITEIPSDDATDFLKILEKYSKIIGIQIHSGFSITALNKWKSILTSLGNAIHNRFCK